MCIMGTRRGLPLSVQISPSSLKATHSQAQRPQSPAYRQLTDNGFILNLARPPTGGSIGYEGSDRLIKMRQVNAATPIATSLSVNEGNEVSAAFNHRKRMAAEQQRRMEVTMMVKEDYTGTLEGRERLQRQAERSCMQEEELAVVRFVKAEHETIRRMQHEKELQEENRVKEQYLAKARAQREEMETKAREKEGARKAEMDRKMKALKEAADVKARAEFAKKQHAMEEEAQRDREKLRTEWENGKMQAEDVLGHGMQQDAIVIREREHQSAAEQAQARLLPALSQVEQAKYQGDSQERTSQDALAQEDETKLSSGSSGNFNNFAILETDDKLPGTDFNVYAKNESSIESDLKKSYSSKGREIGRNEGVNAAHDIDVHRETLEEPLSEVQTFMLGSPDLCDNSAKMINESSLHLELNKAGRGINADESCKANELAQNLDVSESQEIVTNELKGTPELTYETRNTFIEVWTISTARERGRLPFAQLLSVADKSPAMLATLKSGDLLVEFGGITSETPKCLKALAECVQKNVDVSILIGILRATKKTVDEFQYCRVLLCPRKWEGNGLLGCQLSPFKWPQQDVDVEKTAPVTEVSTKDEDAGVLVVYDVIPASSADLAGLCNGDILAGCDESQVFVDVANLPTLLKHMQAKRAANLPIVFDVNRWVDLEQCYRSHRFEIPPADGSIGLSLTSFSEYYPCTPTTEGAVSVCDECYYTYLTTALHAAALCGHVTCLKTLWNLLQQESQGEYAASDYLEWRDEDGRTPLFYACYAGQLECVSFLLKMTPQMVNNQRRVVFADCHGDTVLHAATTSGNTAIILLLLESGCAKIDDKNAMCLTCAHVAPNVELLRFLGEQCKADLLATDAEERMPLAYACLRKDIESVHYLCKKHPDFVDYADLRGNTPLHASARLGLYEVVKVLVTYLPSIALYILNEDGQNAAELALANAKEDVAELLTSVMALNRVI